MSNPGEAASLGNGYQVRPYANGDARGLELIHDGQHVESIKLRLRDDQIDDEQAVEEAVQEAMAKAVQARDAHAARQKSLAKIDQALREEVERARVAGEADTLRTYRGQLGSGS